MPGLQNPEYGVAFVAEELGVTPFTARQKLRDAGIEKTGRTYDFKSKKAALAVVKQLAASGGGKKADADDEPKKKKTKRKTKKAKK